jgi:hypothetical protein
MKSYLLLFITYGRYATLLLLVIGVFATITASPVKAQQVTLNNKVTIVSTKGCLPAGEAIAAKILAEEVAKRTGIQWEMSTTWPATGDVIVLQQTGVKSKIEIPGMPALPAHAEAYRVGSVQQNNRTIIQIEGRDSRGVLFGAGHLLRVLQYQPNKVSLAAKLALAEWPEVPVRGHQLGYRNTANSYDGWTPEQYDQYIRELVIFGANSVETIPFAGKPSPHFKVPPEKMNILISEMCKKYEVDYWAWTPVETDLSDAAKRTAYIAECEKLYKEVPKLDAIFFPGGDPGHNPPELMMPLLESLAPILKKYHPKATIWLSLQGFTPEQSQFVYKYMQTKMPDFMGGLVSGPSSPPFEETRAALPAVYGLRNYPDITHTVRCDYPVAWWDPAFNFTLGREPVNPQPYYYANVYRHTVGFTNGFITYSDGAHDDINKMVWSQLGWHACRDVRNTVLEYANFFFASDIAATAGDGILALEKNWEGPIVANGGIAATLQLWQNIEQKHPELAGNWRWQMCLLRAYYDAFTRERYIYEAQLEEQANAVLLNARTIGAATAMEKAEQILSAATTNGVKPLWHRRIIDLCEALYASVQLQTSVVRYMASGAERGAVLDFLDRPLNNRWWLEDEFKRIRTITDKALQLKTLDSLAQYENPGPGSFYDNVANVSKSPHVVRGESIITDPQMRRSDFPGFDWWEGGMSRKRLSWMMSLRWPEAVSYEQLDSTARYTVQVAGYGESLLKANGQRLTPTAYGKGIGERKVFPVPAGLIKEGKLVLTWDTLDEEHINWRQHSRVSEVWLIKEK